MRAASVLMVAQLLLAAEVHEWGEMNATEWATGWPEPNTTAAGTLVRLGNHTLDSSKSFRVPSYSAPPELATNRPDDDIVVATTAETPLHSMTSAPSRWSVIRPHHHQDRRYGPQFEDDGNTSTVVVQQGDTAHLNCRVSLLQDKTVSWTRRRTDGALELLTVGEHTYAADPRYVVQRRYPGNWRLGIQRAAAHDAGIYECQISTHPPRVIRVQLRVNTPQVWIVDEGGAPLWEQYYEAESTLSLRCVARHVDAPVALAWWHEGRELNADTTRGGISVRTEQVTGGADSRLRLARVSANDAGNYTCGVRGARAHTVAVHVLNESLAELHQGSGDHQRSSLGLLLALLLLIAGALNSS